MSVPSQRHLGTAMTPGRVRFGLLLLLLYAVTSNIGWLRTIAASRHVVPAQDEVSRNDQRLHGLRTVLPRGAVLGYVTSPVPTPRCSAEAGLYQSIPYRRNRFRRLVLAQYALAPTIISPGAPADSVLGVFPPGEPESIPEDLRVVRDFGDGILLLSREPR